MASGSDGTDGLVPIVSHISKTPVRLASIAIVIDAQLRSCAAFNFLKFTIVHSLVQVPVVIR